ncbi:MAG TPA: NUDIX hydrolase [Candidatus Dormibacteraeota bacterium]|nr:NUDIX hydrolase [Candidatus Dormibacteraeota bacterium]
MTQRPQVPTGLAGALGDGRPVTPRPASTVLLVDQAVRPWRLLMMRRPGGADFAPGAYVFPGGSHHTEDAEFADPARAAGIRELFEEVGVLLARRPNGRFARDRECVRLRTLLADGSGWVAALSEVGLTVALDRLTFLARWVTPEPVRRRFDTRFYLARRPAGQTIHPQAGEVDDWLWISPGEALEPGGPSLVHATRRVLESVASEPDPGRLIARLRRRRETPPVVPQIRPRPGGGFDVLDDARPPASSGDGR